MGCPQGPREGEYGPNLYTSWADVSRLLFSYGSSILGPLVVCDCLSTLNELVPSKLLWQSQVPGGDVDIRMPHLILNVFTVCRLLKTSSVLKCQDVVAFPLLDW